MNIEATSLPTGYSYTELPHVSRAEIIVLFHSTHLADAHWSEIDYMADIYSKIDGWRAEVGVATQYLSVHSQQNVTVGVACLRTNQAQAELSCLAVLPDHRSQGIGKWLISERLRRARLLQLSSAYVSDLEKTNTLASYYSELGFLPCKAGVADPAFSARGATVCGPGFLVRF